MAGVQSRGLDVRIFLNRNLLTKALQFGLTKVETIDPMSPLRFSQGGRQMIVMPTRPNPAPTPTAPPTPASPAAASPAAEAQTEPEAKNAPTATNPPPQSAEQPERNPMPEQPSNTNGAPRPNTTVATPPALETALAQIEILRGDFRNGIAGLNKLADALKQAQRESKASDKEVQSVRQTLRSLQSVRL